MAGSIAVDVKKAVIDGFTAVLTALDDFNGTTSPEGLVEVAYGYDAKSHAAQRVWAGRSYADTPPAALRAGRNHRDETGFFDVTVLVAAVGGSADEAEQRAMDIGAVFEEFIADRKSNELGVPGLQTLIIPRWEMTPMFNDRGSLAELTYQVRWTARLT